MSTARVFVLLWLLTTVSFAALHRKHLAGPPEEFSTNNLPLPEEAALEERSAQYEIRFGPDSNNPQNFLWKVMLPVDSDELFSFSIFSPVEDKFKVLLADPQGNQVDLTKHTHTGELSAFPIGLEFIPGVNYFFEAPFPMGEWTLTISTDQPVKPRGGSEADGLLFFYNESPVKAHTYLNTYKLHMGGQIGLVTRLTDAADGTVRPAALRDVIDKAVMEVRNPDGVDEEVPMHDDGLHGDGEPNDGVYGGFISATEAGIYRAEAYIEGVSSNGQKLARSTQHLLPIVIDQIDLTGFAFAVPKDENHYDILLSVISDLDTSKQPSLTAYTELWGTDANGNEIAICWLGGLVDVENVDGIPAISLELDINWVLRAGAQAPFTLKNVRIQDGDVYIPLDEMDEIPVQVFGAMPNVTAPMAIEITKEMRQGVFPKELLNSNRTNADNVPSLLLLHGYCSSVNPWQKYMQDFTDGTYFLEPSASLTNEKFAQLVIEHVQELGMTHWGGIGHSQGGIVLAHLLNYYFSGLDQSTGGRKIQSVGSPYLGNTGAGSAANLIKIFGFGCGENFDLTVDGTKLWLAGITKETRKEIYYYTTTYKQGKLFGDHCNLATNLILKWPNDGTTELSYAVLDGGNSMGNKEGWCHTTDMNYEAQYYDRDRNKEMNDLAAR